MVYALNDGGSGHVAGFRNEHGTLAPIAGSARPFSAAGGTGPAQVGISSCSDVLVTTERNTRRVDSHPLSDSGRAAPLRA